MSFTIALLAKMLFSSCDPKIVSIKKGIILYFFVMQISFLQYAFRKR